MNKGTITSLIFSLLYSASTFATQVANYDFQDSLASSSAAPNLTDLGAGMYVDDTVFSQACRVFSFEAGAGLSLDISGLLGGSSYTFVATINLAEVNSYAKILDVRNRTIDEGLYANRSDLVFYDYSNLDLDQLSSNTWAQVALTYDGTTLVGYVNGVQTFSETDTESVGAIISDTLFFFRDDTATSDGENSSGSVANIQLYDEDLSPADIGALAFNCGDNGAGPTPAITAVPAMPIYYLVATILGLILVARRHRTPLNFK